jgi:hypothetical protein
MLQRTISSLGQVVGWRKQARSTDGKDAERRVWVRYPCDVEATCQPANTPEAMRLSARVRNISRGGINLVMDCPVQSGSLLSVELPAARDELASTVLAYVVRVAAQWGGEWSVGCTFASELNDEDLEPFGARRLKHSDRDQRTWVRFPCHAQASYTSVKGDEPKPGSAHVLNISANGIGLLADRHVELGKLLNLELRNSSGDFSLSILACVVRLTRQSETEWALGCNLIRELSEQELKALQSK